MLTFVELIYFAVALRALASRNMKFPTIMICATSKGLDQAAHMRSLISALQVA